MKRYTVYDGEHPYFRADDLAEAVDLVRYGDPRQMIEPIHPDARDQVVIEERDRRDPYPVLRRLTFAEALAETEGEYARDAGDICHVCGQVVTWTDHLPPLEAGGPVRCFVNVRSFSRQRGPGERLADGQILYSAEWLA